MADTASGLEQPDANEAVNSEAGFAAALAAKGVEPDKGDAASSDTSIAQGLETVEPGPARDPATGRFASKQTPAADTPQEQGADTSTDGGQQVTSDDPSIAAYLAKYNGDVEKALKGAAHAQSLLGKRDEERDALAQQVAELRGLVEGLKVGVTQQAQPVLSDEDVETQAAAMIARSDYVTAATEAANASLQSGDSRVYDSILEQWVIESPINAQRFDLDFQMWKREQAAPKTTTTVDPWVADQKASSEMTATLGAIKADVGDQAFSALVAIGDDGESAFTKALASMPKEVLDLVTAEDPATRLAGTRIVTDRALLIAGTAPAPATSAEQDGGMPPSVARKLAGAGVATAGLRPVTPPQGGQESKDEAIAAFKSAILEAETTSVASGLTYGPQGK